jgi:hypothetical protein
MNLRRRIKSLEAKARAAAPGDLTLAVVRRMIDGTITDTEWRHYGPILNSLMSPAEPTTASVASSELSKQRR